MQKNLFYILNLETILCLYADRMWILIRDSKESTKRGQTVSEHAKSSPSLSLSLWGVLPTWWLVGRRPQDIQGGYNKSKNKNNICAAVCCRLMFVFLSCFFACFIIICGHLLPLRLPAHSARER